MRQAACWLMPIQIPSNLAARLEDGQQISILHVVGGGTVAPSASTPTQPPFTVVSTSTRLHLLLRLRLVNINTATAQQLDTCHALAR